MIAFDTPQAVYRPAVLAELYGSQLASWDDGQQVFVFVDDHHCC